MNQNEFLREQLSLLKRKQTDPNLEWQDIADFRAEYYGDLEHRDTSRKGSKILYEYLNAGWVNEPCESNEQVASIDFTAPTDAMQAQKERYKAQTTRLETNRWLRELARDEMIAEEICKSISKLQPLPTPAYIKPERDNRSYLLAFADCHYGVELSIKDIFNMPINEYSPEIFEERMWDMFNQVVEIVKENDVNELHVWDLGDGIDGIIRLSSQLLKLRFGVIESSIKYAEFIATWMNELSKYVRVKFQMEMHGNHQELRLCGAPKGSFAEENLSKVILLIIKERLKDNQNVTILENPTGYAYAQMSTYPVIGVHGEFKSKTPLDDLSRSLSIQFSYLIGGHVHHSKSEELGVNFEQISVRSIIGVDTYAMSLNKSAKAGASLFTFDQFKGLVREDKIILN